MTTEQKFHAAVNVIRSLPKTGSFQPSTEMMLRFYSYFKQATEGKCNISKPAFWDVRNRAKWESWNGLGNMPREKAMEEYVIELQKIVETMSYTDNVAAFFDTVDSDYPSLPKEDLELVAGDILRKFKSASSSASTSRDTSPMRTISHEQQNGHYESDDEFIDTVDSEESEIPAVNQSNNYLIPNGHATIPQTDTPTHLTHLPSNDINLRVLEELRKTVACLEKDMAMLKEKMQNIERNKALKQTNIITSKPSWWPFRSVTPGILVILIVWPVVANRLVAALRKRRAP